MFSGAFLFYYLIGNESMSMSYSVLYKNTDQRQVLDLPSKLSKLTVLKTFRNHNLMIRTLYLGFDIIADSTTFTGSAKGRHQMVTLTTVDDGLGICIELGLGMKIISH